VYLAPCRLAPRCGNGRNKPTYLSYGDFVDAVKPAAALLAPNHSIQRNSVKLGNKHAGILSPRPFGSSNSTPDQHHGACRSRR
jgi:hypothetical protein